MSTKFATIETSRGTMTAELFDRDCPVTVDNFTRLANAGFYDGVRFHRVVPGTLAQTGDPLSRELPPDDPRVGTGGPGYTIACETIGNRNMHDRGALSMAHAGRDTGGSQFFFVLDAATCESFNRRHTVFGMTTAGLDVLEQIEPNDAVVSVRVWE